MPYRSEVRLREKTGAVAAVVAIHAALLLALLNLAGKVDLPAPQSALKLFDLKPPEPPPPHHVRRATAKQKQGASAPKNIRSQATPVVAPKPQIPTPPVQHIIASATPRQGTAPTQGASDVHGTGTGAGGAGNGTGSGIGGNGEGGGIAEPPHLATPVLRGGDFPPEVIDQWPAQATVFLRLRIDPNGYVIACDIIRGTGLPQVDGPLCNIAHERLRFRPALNRGGQAVAGWFGYAQPAPR